jgi:rRNA-processing protein FCF1
MLEGREMTTKEQKRQPLQIIIDSNALFIPLQYKIDIFSELCRLLNRNFELVLIPSVKKELENLAQKKTSAKTRKNAQFALTFIENLTQLNVLERANEQTDDAIVRIAKKLNAPVLTNDKQLKRKLRDISMPVIYVRAKSHLEIDGLIP